MGCFREHHEEKNVSAGKMAGIRRILLSGGGNVRSFAPVGIVSRSFRSNTLNKIYQKKFLGNTSIARSLVISESVIATDQLEGSK